MNAVAFEQQQQSNWCWIACFRMAASVFGKAVPAQCTIAQQFLGVSGCCPPGINPLCNKPIPETKIPALFSSCHMAAAPLPQPYSDLLFKQVISAGRLILAFISLPATGHFVLIDSLAAGQYSVDDPNCPGPGFTTFDQIANYPPGGQLAIAWSVSVA